MSFPTVTEIYGQARATLADVEVSGGQIYTDTVLLPFVQEAVRRLKSVMKNVSDAMVIKTFYYILPANTSVLAPSTAGINDLTQPIYVEERGDLTTVNVSGATQAAGGLNITTATAHGFSTGNIITLNALGGLKNANGLFGITVTGGSTFTANGVVTVGTYTSGGVACFSNNQFSEMAARDQVKDVTEPTNTLNYYAWSDGQFFFHSANEQRQLRVAYYSSAATPTSGSDIITIDDSLDFLATYTAAKAARSRRAIAIAGDLIQDAVGNYEGDGIIGGKLREIVNTGVKEWQNLSPEERRRKPFREQVTSWPLSGGW